MVLRLLGCVVWPKWKGIGTDNGHMEEEVKCYDRSAVGAKEERLRVKGGMGTSHAFVK